MGVLETVATSAVERVFVEYDRSSSRRRAVRRVAEEFSSALQAHQAQISEWSASLNVYGFGYGRTDAVSDVTLPLQYSAIPRKFRPFGSTQSRDFDEISLISRPGHTLLLGDPGAGKTTTVKRLIRRILVEEPMDPAEPDVAILAIAREHPLASSLADLVEQSLGTTALIAEIDRIPRRQAKGGVGEEEDPDLARRIRQRAVARLLDELNATVFLDGLDESLNFDELSADLEQSSRLLRRSRIIATCRSGLFDRNLEGMEAIEICELSIEQINDIAQHYLQDDASDFLLALSGVSLELARRPLFLMIMMAMYDRQGNVPDQPAVLCRGLVRLSLQDWDSQRRIRRSSRYAGFDADRKLEFLAALAYELLCDRRARSFSTSLLQYCYDRICDNFQLPKTQSRQIVAELETHTGIIMENGTGFEFSHLLIQEYLAADHLVRHSRRMTVCVALLPSQPQMVAMAVAMASDSAYMLIELLRKVRSSGLQHRSLELFADRLGIERPGIAPSMALGIAITDIASRLGSFSPIGGLLEVESIVRSARMSIEGAYAWAGEPTSASALLLPSPQRDALGGQSDSDTSRDHSYGAIEVPDYLLHHFR